MTEFARDNNVPVKTDYISRKWLLVEKGTGKMASIKVPIMVNLPDNWVDMVAERLIKEGDCVLVVRCKDCKHAIRNLNHPDKPLICCLTRRVGETDEDWFCGRRIKGGQNG